MKGRTKGTIGLTFASITWFLVLSGRRTVSVLLVDIEGTFSIDHAQAGLAMTAMFLVYGLMQFPSGVISDIKGRKTTIAVAIMIMGVSLLLIGLSVHYMMFMAAMMLFGLGSGSFQTPGISMISDLYVADRGRALGIQSSAGSLAGLVPIVAPIIALIDWRLFFLGAGIITLLVGYLFIRMGKETTTLPGRIFVRERLLDGIKALKNPITLFIFIITILMVYCWIGYTTFFPAYLIEVKSFSVIEAGIAFSVLLLGGMLLKPMMGRISDSRSKMATMMLVTSTGGVFTVLTVLVDGFVWVLVFSFFLSVVPAFFLVTNSLLLKRWEEKGRGGKLGFFRSLTVLLGSPTSALIGYSAMVYGFDRSFILISAVLLLISVAILVGILVQKKNSSWTIRTRR
ncbi:MAG: MFS transporter [Thermoplasmatota archaeon]